MPQTKYRAQILLEPEQHEALVEVARRENRSISEVVREILSEWLSEQENNILWQKRREALKGLARMRLKIQEEHGIYAGNIMDEVRTERDEDLNRILRGDG
jgi:Arc/MetJ-type ribon-helix-helix transcriptional regulator